MNGSGGVAVAVAKCIGVVLNYVLRRTQALVTIARSLCADVARHRARSGWPTSRPAVVLRDGFSHLSTIISAQYIS